MSVKLLTENYLEFLSLKGATQARLSLHMSKCHIVGNHVTWLNHYMTTEVAGEQIYQIMKSNFK